MEVFIVDLLHNIFWLKLVRRSQVVQMMTKKELFHISRFNFVAPFQFYFGA